MEIKINLISKTRRIAKIKWKLKMERIYTPKNESVSERSERKIIFIERNLPNPKGKRLMSPKTQTWKVENKKQKGYK